MERELLCPVCKGMYKHPVILPCKHNVCEVCASEILLQRGYVCDPNSEPNSAASSPAARSPRMARRVIPKQERLIKQGFGTYPGRKRGSAQAQTVIFPCPSCQHDVDLGEKGLGNLFRNLTLERIVERYRQTVNISTAIMCQFCKPPQQEASKGCTECRASYCNECFKLYHPWGTQKAQHEPTPPTLTFRPKGLTCPDHKEEVVFYCKTCQRLVCQICKVRRTHSGHKITPIIATYQGMRDKLHKNIAYNLGSQDNVQVQISQLKESTRQTEMCGAKALEEVIQQVSTLRSTLDEKQAFLTREIADWQRERLHDLEDQVRERESLLENSGLMCYAQEVMKEIDPACFVLAAKQLHDRMVRAIQAVQSFRTADYDLLPPFKLDISREMKLLTELNFVRAPDAPVIDTQRTYAYNQIFLNWRLPQDSPPAWHYTVEYRKTDPKHKALKLWQRREEIWGLSTVLEGPEINSVYVLRVRGYNKAGYGEYSEDIYLHTPPAPVLNFALDSSCGFARDRLVVSKDRRAVRSVPGVPMLFAAERLMTSCHVSMELVMGDVSVTQGRHYWECSVDHSSYVVKVGVGQENKLKELFQMPQDVVSPSRYDPDSGHDSGAEDATLEVSPLFSFLTIGMGKILQPHGSPPNSRDPTGCTVPLPPRLGICLDYEKGSVGFYDAVSHRNLWEGSLDCSGPVCPAFCFIGGGALQLQELVSIKHERKVAIGGFTKAE
ncbi:tripartite motif-containing protein 46 [Rhinophrynus dorsalis]